ncbi:ABC transporter permease [Aureimonas fodinaquatilis]|uniref:ABC transporter permease n=1 Tax=Aureimonas fodinaquatilis TaxID=2565783 RepID=UPI00165E3340|nr:ABC transporter permease [Aureimonas fodinaquatilis]
MLGPLLKREIRTRHKGTFGGLYWYVIQNVIIVLIYSSVFGSILRGMWREEGLGEINFTIVLFLGLIQYNLLSEILIRAPHQIVQNANLVTKVLFPLEILPVILTGVAVFNALVAFCVLLVAAFVLNVPLSWNGLWLPAVVAPLVIGAVGLAWILAALGTYVRDVGQVVTLLVTAMMFLSPLFYPIGMLPEGLRMLVAFNPLTVPIMEARSVLIFGQTPNFTALGIYWLAACSVMLLGRWIFEKMRGGFADVV